MSLKLTNFYQIHQSLNQESYSKSVFKIQFQINYFSSQKLQLLIVLMNLLLLNYLSIKDKVTFYNRFTSFTEVRLISKFPIDFSVEKLSFDPV